MTSTNVWTLSIDLGTTNTAAAMMTSVAVPSPLPLSSSGTTMPSAVYIGAGSEYVGEIAERHGIEDPISYFPSPKRLLDSMDGFALGADPARLLAAILREAYGRAVARHGGTPPDITVLTHPEAWSRNSLDTLELAAANAGIAVDRTVLLSEPRAAAAHFAMQSAGRESGPAAPSHVLIVDIGGGTVDTALVEVSARGYGRVLSAYGDGALGGGTLDRRFTDVLHRHVEEDIAREEFRRLASDPSFRKRITAAREDLSSSPDASVAVPLNEDSREIVITREEFESEIEPDVVTIVDLAHHTISAAGIDATTVQTYLTGGVSLTPLIQERLGDSLHLKPVADPFYAASLGALEWLRLSHSNARGGTPTVGASAARSTNAPSRPTRSKSSGTVRLTFIGLAVASAVIVALVAVLMTIPDEDAAPTITSPAPGPSHPLPGAMRAVTVAGDSAAIVDDELNCGALLNASAIDLLELEWIETAKWRSSGVLGNTSCRAGEFDDDISIETFTPNLYPTFAGNFATEPVADDELWGWYTIRTIDESIRPTPDYAVFIDGRGWLVLRSSSSHAADSRVIDVAKAITPHLKIERL